jgi:NADH dehydrogenase FAD-containing subunit
MKIALQYVNNAEGQTQSVQIPISDWQKLCLKLKHYEQALQLKKDLTTAFKEVDESKKNKIKKQTLTDFLNEL